MLPLYQRDLMTDSGYKVIVVAGAAFVSYAIARFFLDKTGKQSESASNASGEGMNAVSFTATNASMATARLTLFDSYDINGTKNQGLTVSQNAPFFARDIATRPKTLKVIEIRSGANQTQASAPFRWVCRDANGDESASSVMPTVSPMQAQPNITGVSFGKGAVIDGHCYMDYPVAPNTSVTITAFYNEGIEPKTKKRKKK